MLRHMKPFKNINDAIYKLSEVFPKDINRDEWLLLSISDNGDIIAKGLSEKLNIRWERFYIESVYCQLNVDCKIAMISEFKDIVVDEVLRDFFQIDKHILDKAIDVIFNYKLMPKLQKERNSDNLLNIEKNIKNVVFVDESVETGLRVQCAMRSIENRFDVVQYIATPIIPDLIYSFLDSDVEKIFHVEKPEIYTNVYDYYLDKVEENEDVVFNFDD